MTEKHRVPHKLSVASAYRRVAAKFRRQGDHRTTDDYQRATDHSDQPHLRREEAVWRGGLGGGF